jgi:hypothetical protein
MLPYFVWRRRWTAVGWFSGAAILAFGAGFAICGPQAYRSWFAALSDVVWQGLPFSMSVLSWLTRAFDDQSAAPLFIAPALIRPLWLLGTFTLLLLAHRYLREEDADRDYAAVLTVMLLITPSGWIYYLPLCVGPVAATLAKSHQSWLWTASVLLLLMPYPFVAVAAGSPLILLTIGSVYVWGGVGLLIAVLKASASEQHGVVSARASLVTQS